MKICITALGDNLKSQLDPRFGRCSYILVADTETQEVKAVENKGTYAARGAGINTAQVVSDLGCQIVITGNVGPKAFRVLEASNIEMFMADSGKTCEEVLKDYNNGQLTKIEASRPCGRGSGLGGFGGRHGRRGQCQ